MTDEGSRPGSGLYNNLISYLGGLIALLGGLLILASLLFGLGVGRSTPYLGILTFMVFPAIIAFGLLVSALGMWLESRKRRRRPGELTAYPRLDLNIPKQRRRFSVILLGGGLALVLLALIAYNGFLFTESVTFCGQLCHTVMEPEAQSHTVSPHARVRCVDCHVGEGAGWYVRSKLSGIRQLFAVIFNTYERPIPTPIPNLRPARETCEECHWPSATIGAQLFRKPIFSSDEVAEAEEIAFLLKTGGGAAGLPEPIGIHWHTSESVEVTYVALDKDLFQIPWFQVKRPDGSVAEYRTTDRELDDQTLASLERRVMDCVDCHNRPAHQFGDPVQDTDQALLSGAIARDLPYVKKVVVEAIQPRYPSHAAARERIRAHITGFYQDQYPDVAQHRAADIENAVEAAIDIYVHSVFPQMLVWWGTYPEHIGHKQWPGCFRCHDGRHVSDQGEILAADCELCHTTPLRSPLRPFASPDLQGSRDWHPFPLNEASETRCPYCHSPVTGQAEATQVRP